MSPNFITILGTLIQLSPLLILIFYDLTLGKEIPLWLSMYFMLAIFLNQTCDAVDGKQARKINRCSPIGELLDHGLDGFAACFNVITAIQMLRYSNTFHSVLNLALLQVILLTQNK